MIAHQKLLQVVERRGHPREIVEALVLNGADREYFADKEKLESLAQALTTAKRTVTVQRDEEHNRYLLHVEDRSSGYPGSTRSASTSSRRPSIGRFSRIGATCRAVNGEIIVKATADLADEVPDEAPSASTDGTAIGGAPADPATKLAAEPKDRAIGAKKEEPPKCTCGRSTSS